MTDFRGAEGGSRDHYPYITRSLLELYDEGALPNVTDVVVESEYGYVANITYDDGSHRMTCGNDLGLNGSAAGDVARDKGHTKFFLRAWGIECPDGEEFLMPWWADTIRQSQVARGNTTIKTTNSAQEYIESTHGYPVYVKPVDGSKGAGVYKVHSANELPNILESYAEKRVRVAMVEESINMPDYRIVTLDGELISAYRRIPLAVTGNGKDNVRTLLEAVQQRYFEEGRDTRIDPNDPRILAQLRKQAVDFDHVPAAEAEIVLASISNLSAGGTSEDVSDRIAQRWVDLTAYVAKNFSLRLCGLDLACNDITNEHSDYSVIEVNAAPGLDHYASSGEEQSRKVRELYARVLNAYPTAVQ